MLFTKEISNITFQDVIDFCNERIPESINLDYKKDFPSDLEKTISAFANSMGGMIIIGVEDEDSRPKLPVIGLDYTKGLSERVVNIILGNIYPPFIPEIQVCEPVNNKTFVIIRIPQSNTTPHYIRHRTQIYIRTENVTSPEELASAERVEWLRDRRKKSEELRSSLYRKAFERYNNFLKLNKTAGISFAEATISISPLYPEVKYKTPQEIKNMLSGIQSRGYYAHSFPNLSQRNEVSVQNGVSIFHHNEANQYISYAEFNNFGLIYQKEDIGHRDFVEETNEKGEKNKKEVKILAFYMILMVVDLFLETASKFYENLGYWGLLDFNFSIEKLLGIKLKTLNEDLIIAPWERNRKSNENILELRREYYVRDIKDKRIEIIVDLMKEIGWSLGSEYTTEEKIEYTLESNHRLS